jgi:glycosyltransferase involved in cell wall biosynthesis
MKPPLISICIPTHYGERYLPAALESVRAQHFTDWELIVIEDGSRDATEDIVREFARTVAQTVRYDRHAQSLGRPAARNTGITSARGDWIALLDAEDVWTAGHLEAAADLMPRTSAELIHSGAVLFDSDTGLEISVRAPSSKLLTDVPLNLLNGAYHIQPSSVLIRRQLWEDVGGFDPNFHQLDDREMWIRCARSGAHFAYTGVNTCLYRQQARADRDDSVATAVAHARLIEKNLDWEAVPPDERRTQAASAWLAAGRLSLREDPAAALGFFGRALRYRALTPAAVGYWVAAAFLNYTRRRFA